MSTGPPSATPLLLSDIRDELIRQEETIIFAMIERCQFKYNAELYKSGAEGLLPASNPDYGLGLTFVGHFLKGTEILHAQLGRYCDETEKAFFSDVLPQPTLPRTRIPSKLKANRINMNAKLFNVYVDEIVPKMCPAGSDLNFGSSSVCDIAVLQALSKRVHYGCFVAEAKFQQSTAEFSALINANDGIGLMALLTNEVVERKVIDRVSKKAARYATEADDSGGEDNNGNTPANATGVYKVNPEIIAALYRDFLIPLNKEVQVAYLLQRLDRKAFATVESAKAAGEHHFGAAGAGNVLSTIADVFASVMRNEVAYGVVPIEGARSGMVKATQAALLESPLLVNACFRFRTPTSGDDANKQDSEEEEVRYFIISNVQPGVTEGTSNAVLFFGTKHEPESLWHVLGAFRSVNLSTLSSLPVQGDKEYEKVFYVELEKPRKQQQGEQGEQGGSSSSSHPGFEEVLQTVGKLASSVKLVGSYAGC